MSTWSKINKDISSIENILKTPIFSSESVRLKNTASNNNGNNSISKSKDKITKTKLPISRILEITQNVSDIIYNLETKLTNEAYTGITELGPNELIYDLISDYDDSLNSNNIPKSSDSNKVSEISNTTDITDSTIQSNKTHITSVTNGTNTTNGNNSNNRNRGRGRPQGSNSRSSNANNNIMNTGNMETDNSITAVNNSTLINEVKREINTKSPPSSTDANTSVSSKTSNTTKESGDKLMTIGAKYGYPSPPPLSTYNGKIGRSFFTSVYNPSTPILPNSQVAYSSGGFNNLQSEWILCRVLKIITETRFEIQDPEPDELHPNGQIFRANYKEIILIPLHLLSNNLSRLKEYKSGSRVLAKYPETTTFYPAEVVNTINGVCMLRFEGEEEVDKLTPVDRVFVLPMPK